jgi:23S rRNA (cytidine1920-2'-O)/16S rRNA (cytidine1409-2'-O)-methyltransferase
VTVSGAPAAKPARLVAPAEPVSVAAPPPRYVSRAGAKLEAALERFGVDPAGRCCLDAGSSTGGFTDCLLQRGAASVAAVDVGRGQLHERLRSDPRVEVHERTDIRSFDPGGRCFGLVVADLSFISLRSVAPALTSLASEGADLVVLVKPQFEAGRAEAARGRGVIRDPVAWRAALEAATTAMQAAGAAIMGLMASPLPGAEGNVEFLCWCRSVPGPAGPIGEHIDRAVDAAAAMAGRG